MRTQCLIAAAWIAVAIVAGGCSESALGRIPRGSSPASPVGPSTFDVVSIAGTVYEYTWDDRRLLPGAAVRLTVTGVPPLNDRHDTFTDDNGSYAFHNVPVPSSATLALAVSGYNHVPCPRATGDYFIEPAPVVDMHVIQAGAAAMGGVPPTYPRSGVYGSVFEEVDGIRMPVSGADVDLWGSDDLLTTVLTDADGRFGFCDAYGSTLNYTWPFWVSAIKGGYRRSGYVKIDSADARRVELQIARAEPGESR